MIKKWIVATYKINEIKRVEDNLLNQEFDYYLPKIILKNINSNPKEELFFPGYIFIHTSIANYSALKYTKGIKSILKFGESISYITESEIKEIKMIEKESKINPITSQISIGQEIIIANGPLKGSLAKICSLPYKKRVDIFISILGSFRRVNISLKDFSI